MNIITTAYKRVKNSQSYSDIKREVVLCDNIISTFSNNQAITNNSIEDIDATKYTFEFLTKCHAANMQLGCNVLISYYNSQQQQDVIYLKLNWYQKLQFKWMNKITFLQRGENGWKLITILFSISLAVIAYMTDKRVNKLENENENYKIIITKLQKDTQEKGTISQPVIKEFQKEAN